MRMQLRNVQKTPKCWLIFHSQYSKNYLSIYVVIQKFQVQRPPCATMEDEIIITLLKRNVSFDTLEYMNNIGHLTLADYFWK